MPYKQCPACLGEPQKKHKFIRSQVFRICSRCGTLWIPDGPGFNGYDASYIKKRGHDDTSPVINSAKKLTFEKFWGKVGKISGSILEVGCSTGISLRVAQDMGLDIYGLDVNEDILEYVQQNGVSKDRVSVNGLEAFSGKKFKVVAFFDSFEHLPDPQLFLSELMSYLSDGAILLFVIPNGGAISRKLLGAYWPHYGLDHWIHYTFKGLDILLNRYNIKINNTFYPSKYVPIEMILRHVATRWKFSQNQKKLYRGLSSVRLYFNFGEKGLVCVYNANINHHMSQKRDNIRGGPVCLNRYSSF